MSEGRKRDNGCSQRNINCGGGVDEIDVHSVTPSTISCDLIDGVPIHQLTKYCEEAGEDKKIYPISVIQAIFDARTGIRLDKVLSMCNAIYLEYEGDFEHTVSKVQSVQRRKGLIVTYRDITNTVSTIRYKSTDLSNKAWNNSDNWEGWSFDTAKSDLLDMITAIFSNIEDYPEIYDALKNQINLVVQDVFGHINNYPAVKKIITDTAKDNLDDVLADIFAHLNNYPQIKSAFDDAFRRYINNVFGNVNNYPQVINAIKTGVANVLDNLDQHPDLKAIIEDAVNSKFYFLNLPSASYQRYDPSKKFKDYTRQNISKTIYDELFDAIADGKIIVLYTTDSAKVSKVVTTKVENKDIYLQYVIRDDETDSGNIETIPNIAHFIDVEINPTYNDSIFPYNSNLGISNQLVGKTFAELIGDNCGISSFYDDVRKKYIGSHGGYYTDTINLAYIAQSDISKIRFKFSANQMRFTSADTTEVVNTTPFVLNYIAFDSDDKCIHASTLEYVSADESYKFSSVIPSLNTVHNIKKLYICGMFKNELNTNTGFLIKNLDIVITPSQINDVDDDEPNIRPEFAIDNIIINGYNNNNQYIGEYIVVRYDFDDFVKYNSNKANSVAILNADDKIGYEQLYPEVIGYEKSFVNRYGPSIGPTQVIVDANEYVTVYSPCMNLTITGGISHYEEKGTRLVKGNFAGKSYVDVYLFNGASNISVTLNGLKFVPGAQAILTEGARYRFEIFEGFVDVKKIDTDAVSNVIAVVAPISVASNLPEHDDGSKFLNVTYKDIYGVTRTEELDLVYHDETPGSEYYGGLLYMYEDVLGQSGIQNLDVNTIFTDLPNLSVTVTKGNGATFTKGSSATTYYYSGRVMLS